MIDLLSCDTLQYPWFGTQMDPKCRYLHGMFHLEENIFKK